MKAKGDFNVVTTMQFADPECRLGEGVSHASDPGTDLFAVQVIFNHECKPMKDYIRAHSAKQARAFALARYPKATAVKIITNKGMNNRRSVMP